jgi:hypothetical protein
MMEEFYAESDYPLDRDGATTSFATLLRDPSLGAIWTVSYDGQLVGPIVLTRIPVPSSGENTAETELFAGCARRNALPLHVEVAYDSVPAQALYGRCGLPYSGRQTLTVPLAKDSGRS